MSHPPIPINELAEHIELLKANDNLRLSQEYEVRDRELFHASVLVIVRCHTGEAPAPRLTFASQRGQYGHDLFNTAIYSVTSLHYRACALHYSLNTVCLLASPCVCCFLFQSIDPSQQFTWEHSNLEVNKPKNRYANVIAYDHTRVILAPIDGERITWGCFRGLWVGWGWGRGGGGGWLLPGG